MSRDSLRPVKATLYREEVQGYFHAFVQEGDIENGINAYAIIELEDGKVEQVDAYTVKFQDSKKLCGKKGVKKND